MKPLLALFAFAALLSICAELPALNHYAKQEVLRVSESKMAAVVELEKKLAKMRTPTVSPTVTRTRDTSKFTPTFTATQTPSGGK